jgi:hypothetical protein
MSNERGRGVGPVCQTFQLRNEFPCSKETLHVNPFPFLLCFFITFLFFHRHSRCTTNDDDERTTNDDEQTVRPPLPSILFLSCLPWLTITLYIFHFLFVFRFATTITTMIAMTMTIMTTPSLLYITQKGCF